MLLHLSNAFAQWLYHAGSITKEDLPVYEHAAYCLCFTLTPLVLVSVIGCLLGMFREGILMIIPFYLLRKFSGGIHLKSPVNCLISSTCLLVLSLLIIRAVLDSGHYFIFCIFVFLSIVLIFFLSPIDSEQKRLSVMERKVFRKGARSLLIFIGGIYFMLVCFNKPMFAIPIGMGMIITAALQIFAFLQKINHKMQSD
jgi:accessory gene regulator B